MRRETVNPKKIEEVKRLAELLSKYSNTGILDFYKMPSAALQKIKSELYGKATLKKAKKNIILFALDKANKSNLKEFVGAHPALILTDMDPFRLSIFLQKKKSNVAAKPGDAVKNDIEVKAGPTDLPPGPAISTLTKVGIAAKVEGGKIAVMRDKVVLKAGENVSGDLAAALNLLKMEPIEIGLTLVAMLEKNNVYKKDQLFVDIEKLMNDVSLAASQAFNLAINSNYYTKQTIEFLLAKAYREAKALEAKPL
jgi:large subunit ribosomal protein L10